MFKRLLLVPVMGLMLLVASCFTPTTSDVDYSPLQAVLDSCETYQETLNDLAAQRRLGNLSQDTIDMVNKSIMSVYPVCTAAVQDVPLDVEGALEVLERELETLALAATDGRGA